MSGTLVVVTVLIVIFIVVVAVFIAVHGNKLMIILVFFKTSETLKA